jgi:hypothetical protein
MHVLPCPGIWKAYLQSMPCQRSFAVQGQVSPSSSSLVNQASVQKFTILKAIAALLFSNLGTILIQLTSDYELHTTSTANVGSTVFKLSVFYLMNTFVVTIIAVYIATRRANISNSSAQSVWCAAARATQAIDRAVPFLMGRCQAPAERQGKECRH